MIATREPLEVDGRTLSVSNLDKVLYPAAGFRKRDLLAYYRAVAPVMLPHLADRAVHLGRWPDGVDHPGWFQANCRGPDWMRTHVATGKRGQTLRYGVIDGLAALLWVATQGTLELHPFQATISRPDEPRAMVFDLDPGPGVLRQRRRRPRLSDRRERALPVPGGDRREAVRTARDVVDRR